MICSTYMYNFFRDLGLGEFKVVLTQGHAEFIEASNIILGQINKLLARNSQELQICSMSHHIADKIFNVTCISLDFVEVCKLSFLILQDFVSLLHPVSECRHFSSEFRKLLKGSHHTFKKSIRIVGNIVITSFELLPISLKFIEFSRTKNISASFDKLSNNIQGIIDGSVMLINIILNLLESIDLVFEAIHILIWHLLTGNVSLNTVQPFVEIIQIFTGLSELFLNRLHRINW